MGHAIWKLTALVGISGLGFLILLQAQQGLQDSHANTETKSVADDAAGDDTRVADAKSRPEPSSETAGHAHAGDHDHQGHDHDGHGHDGHDHDHHAHESDEPDGDVVVASASNPFMGAPKPADEMTPVTQREAASEDEHSAASPPDEPPVPEANPFGGAAPSGIEPANFEEEAPEEKETEAEPQPFRREPEPQPEPDATVETPEEPASDAPAFLGAEGESSAEPEEEAPTGGSADFGPDPFAGFGAPPEPEGETAAPPNQPELAPGPTPAPAGASLGEEEATEPTPSEETPSDPTPSEESAASSPLEEENPAGADPFGGMPGTPEPGDSVPLEATPEAAPEPAPEPMAEESGESPPPAATDLPNPFGTVQTEPEPVEETPATEPAEPMPAEPAPAAGSEAAPSPEPAMSPEPAGEETDPFGSLDDDPFSGLSEAEGLEAETETEAEPEAGTAPPASEAPAFGGAPEPSEPVDPAPPATGAEEAEPLMIEDDPFGTAPAQPEPAPEADPPATDPPLGAPPVDPEMEAVPSEPAVNEIEAPFGSTPGIEARPEPLAGSEDGGPMPPGMPAEPEIAVPDAEAPGAFPIEEGGGENAVEESGGDVPAVDPLAPGGGGTIVMDTPRDPRQAKLTVEKKAPARATLGEPVVYEVIITNVGESPAREVTVSDMVPQGTKIDGTIPQAIMKGDRLTWKLGTLEPKDSTKIRIRVIPTEPGSIGSVATVDFASEVKGETEIVSPKLVLRLSAPASVALGQPVDFQFEIANEGNAPAENVMLRDVLPAGFRHVDGNDLEYEVGTLPPGAVEKVTLRVATVQAGEFSNRAVLTGKGGLKTEATASVEIRGQQVSLIRKGPKQRLVGRPAVYTNIIRNTSPEPVTSAKVLETIPAGMEFVRASQGGQYNPQDRTVAWQVGPLAPGEEKTVEVTLTASTEGAQDSLVRVEEVGGNHVQVSSTTKVASPAGLSSAIEGPDRPVIIGERAAFRIRLENQGTAPAEEVLVSLMLPPQLKFVEARGSDAIPSTQGVTTLRTAEPIPPGGQRMIEFIVEGIVAGSAKLRASIHAAELSSPLVREADLRVVAAR